MENMPQNGMILLLICCCYHLCVIAASNYTGDFLQCSQLSAIKSLFNIRNDIYLLEKVEQDMFFWRYQPEDMTYVQADWLTTLIKTNFYGVVWDNYHINVANVYQDGKLYGPVIDFTKLNNSKETEIFFNTDNSSKVNTDFLPINNTSHIYQANTRTYVVPPAPDTIKYISKSMIVKLRQESTLLGIFMLNDTLYGFTGDRKVVDLSNYPSKNKLLFREILTCYFESTIYVRYLGATLALFVCLILLAVLNICFLTNSLLNRNINQRQNSLRVASYYPSITSNRSSVSSTIADHLSSEVRKPKPVQKIRPSPVSTQISRSEVATVSSKRTLPLSSPPTVKPTNLSTNSIVGCYKKPFSKNT